MSDWQNWCDAACVRSHPIIGWERQTSKKSDRCIDNYTKQLEREREIILLFDHLCTTMHHVFTKLRQLQSLHYWTPLSLLHQIYHLCPIPAFPPVMISTSDSCVSVSLLSTFAITPYGKVENFRWDFHHKESNLNHSNTSSSVCNLSLSSQWQSSQGIQDISGP